MANAEKGHIEIVNGSIGDLIFRIETLTSDRDTIKVCVRAANELSAMTKRIATLEAENARLTAAHAMQGESFVVLPRHMVNSIEEQLKSLRKFAENCAKLEGQEYQVLVDEARIALAGES